MVSYNNGDINNESSTYKLKNALLSLLVEKDISHITTKEITKHAQVSRGVLYSHYDDKYALFDEIFEEMRDGLGEAIHKSLKDIEYINFERMDLKVHPTLSYVAENRLFFRMMVDRTKMPYVNFHQFFLHVYKEDVIFTPMNMTLSDLEREIYSHYRALYTYAIIWYWMKEDFHASPETISEKFWELIREKRFYWLFGNHVPFLPEGENKDRRVLRTRQALHEAMIEMIVEKKNYSAVTISDIARKSNIRRATFYDHYADKEELLKDIIHRACFDLINILTIETITEDISTEQSEAVLTRLFSYLSEHQTINRFISADYGIPDPIPEMFHYLSHYYMQQPISLGASKKMYAYYVSGLIVGVISYRLQEGRQHSPDFLAKEFVQFLDVKKYKVILL